MNFLKIKAVMSKTGLARPTIYKYMKQGIFPKQITQGGRGVAWLESEIEEWMMAQLAKRETV